MLDVPAYIYHFPATSIPPVSTQAKKIEQTLKEMAPNADINFERIAVNQ